MVQLFTNNANTTLAAAVTTTGQTSLTLASGKGALFPSPSSPDFFLLTLDDGVNVEIVKVTARATDVLTVVRAQEGTTAQASFAIGTKVELRLTAGGLNGKRGRAPALQVNAAPTTVTANWDTQDLVVNTGLAAAVNFANPTGTPADGQLMHFRWKDNGTSRAITWGTQFRGVSMPSATTAGKTGRATFEWNAADSKADMLAANPNVEG